MLRAVVVSHHDDHEYDIELYSSVGLAMQMFKQAMTHLAFPDSYQAEVRNARSPRPTMSELMADMPVAKRVLALHDQKTRHVTLIGTVMVRNQTSLFKSLCVMDNFRHQWEPRAVWLDVGTTRHEFIYQPTTVGSSIRYKIEPQSGDAGPQPAKV